MDYEKKIEKAMKYAEKVKLKRELNELKHSNDKPKEKLTFGKFWLIFLLANFMVIEIYSLTAMWFFADLTPLVGLIAAVIGDCVTLCSYFAKSSKENTTGGIVYESAMKKLEHELENSSSMSNDDVVG